MSNRVVITGIGALTPLGIGKERYWEGLVSGKSGIGPITRFDTTGFDVRIAGEVRGFDPAEYLDKREVRRMDRFAQFGVAAAKMALEDARLVITDSNAERIGTLVGTGIGGLESLEEQIRVLQEKGPNRVSPFLIPMMIANMASGMTSILTGAKGPNTTVVTACATGANAIGDSYEILQRGDADAMIAGGTEAAVTPVSIAGFGNMKAMTAKFNDAPETASRPFDLNRDGFVIGEGAGVVILETLDHARARGAHIYAEMIGYGMTADAYHMTQPAPEGEGVGRAMQKALKSAGLVPEQISHINAHATSTPLGDKSESQAIRNLFGDHAKNIPISATKSMTGHLLGGAGGIEAIATALALYHQVLPPTINYQTPDPDCEGLDFVPNQSRRASVDVALCNNFGFGGHNAVLVMKRYTE